MKFGLLTAILEGTTFEEAVDFAAENQLECLEVACWPNTGGAKRRYAGVCHIDAEALTEEKAKENDRLPEMKNKEKQGYTPAKWDLEKYVQNKLINNDKSNANWYFLRYADVLLLYAEALNEWKGYPTKEAYDAINEVRRRAYGNSEHDLSGLSYDEFNQAIKDERAYELAFEGHRRMDLVRWGIYYKTVKETYNAINAWFQDNEPEKNKPFNTAGRYTKLGKHELLPIPQRDMDLCEQFVQNPGWEQ